MKLRKIEVEIPEPSLSGACSHSCRLVQIEERPHMYNDRYTCAFCWAVEDKALHPFRKPGPGCPWYKP